MIKQSTISDLKAALREVAERKRDIEEQHRALVMALRYFENPDDIGHPRPLQSRSPSGGTADAIYEVLAAEHPLHRKEIYDRLVEMGVRFGGQKPIDSMGVRLSNDPRFKSDGKGMWDLAEPLSRGEAGRLQQLDARNQWKPHHQHTETPP